MPREGERWTEILGSAASRSDGLSLRWLRSGSVIQRVHPRAIVSSPDSRSSGIGYDEVLRPIACRVVAGGGLN